MNFKFPEDCQSIRQMDILTSEMGRHPKSQEKEPADTYDITIESNNNKDKFKSNIDSNH